MPKLRVKLGKGWKAVNIRKDVFLLGRSSDCDYVVASGFVSRHHCEIVKEGDQYAIRDFGSKLGTQVNGQPVDYRILNQGDLIELGSKFNAVFLDDHHMPHTGTLRYGDHPSETPPPRLVGKTEPAIGKVFILENQITRVGRDPANEISLDIDTISRFHAELVREDGGTVLIDKSSGNGTFRGNRRVHREVLRHGDTVRFDWVTFRFEDEWGLSASSGKGGSMMNGPRGVTGLLARSLMRSTGFVLPKKQGAARNDQWGVILIFGFFLILLALGFSAGAYFLAKKLTSKNAAPEQELAATVVEEGVSVPITPESEILSAGETEWMEAPANGPPQRKAPLPSPSNPDRDAKPSKPSETGPPSTRPNPVPAEEEPIQPPEPLDDFTVSQIQTERETLARGEDVRVEVDFVINLPDVVLSVERQLYFKNRPLFKAPIVSSAPWTPGRHRTWYSFRLPENARAGNYTMTLRLSSDNTQVEEEVHFLVEP